MGRFTHLSVSWILAIALWGSIALCARCRMANIIIIITTESHGSKIELHHYQNNSRMSYVNLMYAKSIDLDQSCVWGMPIHSYYIYCCTRHITLDRTITRFTRDCGRAIPESYPLTDRNLVTSPESHFMTLPSLERQDLVQDLNVGDL